MRWRCMVIGEWKWQWLTRSKSNFDISWSVSVYIECHKSSWGRVRKMSQLNQCRISALANVLIFADDTPKFIWGSIGRLWLMTIFVIIMKTDPCRVLLNSALTLQFSSCPSLRQSSIQYSVCETDLAASEPKITLLVVSANHFGSSVNEILTIKLALSY